MTVPEVMEFLKDNGSEQTRKVFRKHGAREPFYGVRISDLNRLKKKIKTDHSLALELYNTGNSDAMYLAGMIADPLLMNRKTLNKWAYEAYWYMLSDYTVASLAAKSECGFETALEWIDSGSEFVESAGWSTLSNYISLFTPEPEQMQIFKALLERAGSDIQNARNRVRYSMNGFIIACGSFDKSLNTLALRIASEIGTVNVEMGDTACKVPPAEATIQKVSHLGRLGVKRK